MSVIIRFDHAALTPLSWRGDSALTSLVRVFNPALIRTVSGWLMAYRFVGPDQLRRIAFCRLNEEFKVIENSCVAFSDLINVPGRCWFADPRFYKLNGRHYVYWNSGWEEPTNKQFLQEFDIHTLLPVGLPRVFTYALSENKIEKNWMLFEEECILAVYSVNPHRILNVNIEKDSLISFTHHSEFTWDNSVYERQYGALRGGCPPVKRGDIYYSLCHSVFGTPENYRYVAAFYCFSALGDFRPLAYPLFPLDLYDSLICERKYSKLNPAVGDVIYPCGALYIDGQWIISYGINDEQCAIALVSDKDIQESLSFI